MYTAIATLVLSLVLTFFSVGVSEAELWVCSQPDGSNLFTDEPQKEASCEKHQPVSQLIYAPPRIWADAPLANGIYEGQAYNRRDAQPASRAEEQYAADATGDDGSFYGDDENPPFTEGYAYVPGFYGVPYLRHMHARDFSNRSRTQHEIQHPAHVPSHSGPPMPSTHFHEHSVQAPVQEAPTHSQIAAAGPAFHEKR